jgi:hypothetical protein
MYTRNECVQAQQQDDLMIKREREREELKPATERKRNSKVWLQLPSLIQTLFIVEKLSDDASTVCIMEVLP